MRFIDFLVYYPATNFKNRKMGGWSYGSELGRAVFLASLTISLFSFAMVEFAGAMDRCRLPNEATSSEEAIVLTVARTAQPAHRYGRLR